MALGALAPARVLARRPIAFQRVALVAGEVTDYRFHLGQPGQLLPAGRGQAAQPPPMGHESGQ